jgi:hypothetical protein
LGEPRVEELETYLKSEGVVFERLDRDSRSEIAQRWKCIFGNAFQTGKRFKEGVKAWYALTQLKTEEFYLFSLTDGLSLRGFCGNHNTWGYRCAAGKIPDLGPFATMEFILVAFDFSWTMVYTHEDFALCGPFFAEMEWVVDDFIPDDDKKSKRTRRTRGH